MIILASVGSAFDPKTLLVYPLLANGDVDTYEGTAVALEDVVNYWVWNLSASDYIAVHPHLPKPINFR